MSIYQEIVEIHQTQWWICDQFQRGIQETLPGFEMRYMMEGWVFHRGPLWILLKEGQYSYLNYKKIDAFMIPHEFFNEFGFSNSSPASYDNKWWGSLI